MAGKTYDLPHVRVEITGPDDLECFLVIFNPPEPGRPQVLMSMHATELMALSARANEALMEWLATASTKVLHMMLNQEGNL